jgi:hypothetical protein
MADAAAFSFARQTKLKGRFPRLLLAGVSACCAACAPFPHQVARVPEIRGLLLSNGAPAANATVFAGWNHDFNHPCTGLPAIGSTNGRGEFAIDARMEWELLYSFINPPNLTFALTSVCFQAPGKEVMYGGQFATRHSDVARVSVTCDTEQPKRSSVYAPQKICNDVVRPRFGG